MIYQVQIPFKTKSGEVTKGQIINMSEDKSQPLLRTWKITELGDCHNCHEFAWWVSVYGVLRCGVCSPPAPRPGLVKKWIDDKDRLATMKAASGQGYEAR